MTPGVFAGLVADELDVDVATVALLQRSLREGGAIPSHGRGRAATHVSLEEAVKVLMALCATMCGCTALQAGNIARRADTSWVARLADSLLRGQVFVFERDGGSDLRLSARISSRAITAIRDAAFTAARRSETPPA